MNDTELMPPPPRPFLNLTVTDGNHEMHFFVKRTWELKWVMAFYCLRTGYEPQDIRFMFRGDRVRCYETPAEVSCFMLLFNNL